MIDQDAIKDMAHALAAATGMNPDEALVRVGAAAEQAGQMTPEQMANRVLAMRLNARLAGRVFVPNRPVRRGVKR